MAYDVREVVEALGGERVIGARIRSLDELRAMIERGLPKHTLVHLTKIIYRDSPRQRRLRDAIVPEATFRRRVRLSHSESERTERLARIAALAKRIWGEEERARSFLTSPHPLLGGRTPAEAAASELGARQVEDILAAIEYGLPA